jgi:hypothetical protein
MAVSVCVSEPITYQIWGLVGFVFSAGLPWAGLGYAAKTSSMVEQVAARVAHLKEIFHELLQLLTCVSRGE